MTRYLHEEYRAFDGSAVVWLEFADDTPDSFVRGSVALVARDGDDSMKLWRGKDGKYLRQGLYDDEPIEGDSIDAVLPFWCTEDALTVRSCPELDE